jgi:hypothetical protein
VNRKLTDEQIFAAVSLLRSRGERVGWRRLQALLTTEYGVAGRTDRLREACRTVARMGEEGAVPPTWQLRLAEADRQTLEARRERDLALARAARSEERETAHQDRWASEIHSLRETVERLKAERVRRQHLEEQVLRMQRELQSLYARLSRHER